jgi:hypothetical protein
MAHAGPEDEQPAVSPPKQQVPGHHEPAAMMAGQVDDLAAGDVPCEEDLAGAALEGGEAPDVTVGQDEGSLVHADQPVEGDEELLVAPADEDAGDRRVALVGEAGHQVHDAGQLPSLRVDEGLALED